MGVKRVGQDRKRFQKWWKWQERADENLNSTWKFYWAGFVHISAVGVAKPD